MISRKQRLLDEGAKFLHRNDNAKALGFFIRALQIDPMDSSLLRRIGEIYFKTGDKQSGINCLQKSAELLSKNGFNKKAIATYRQMVGIEEKPEFLDSLGNAYNRMGLVAEAIISFKRAIELYKAKGKMAEALEMAESLVRISPNSVEFNLILGDLSFKNERSAKANQKILFAAKAMKNAAEVENVLNNYRVQIDYETLTDITLVLIELYRQAKDIGSAYKILRSFQVVNPDEIKTLVVLADLLTSLENPASDKKFIEQCAKIAREAGRSDIENKLLSFVEGQGKNDLDVIKAEEQGLQGIEPDVQQRNFESQNEDDELIELDEAEEPESEDRLDIYSGPIVVGSPRNPAQQEEPQPHDDWDDFEKLEMEPSIDDPDSIDPFDISNIVGIFKGKIHEATKGDAATSYNLAIAFKEMELIDASIEAAISAMKYGKSEFDCLSLLAQCYRDKLEYRNAEVLIIEAIKRAPEGSRECLSFKYELASLYEAIGRRKDAMALFVQVCDEDESFRDVKERIKRYPTSEENSGDPDSQAKWKRGEWK